MKNCITIQPTIRTTMKNQLINILRNRKIPASWLTFYVGRKLGFINNADIIEFAVNQLDNSPPLIKPIVLNLATYYGQKDLESFEKIEKSFDQLIYSLTQKNSCNFNEKIEIDKFLYATLMHLIEHEKNIHALLEKVEQVYADFNYPSSMNGFIGYLPPTNYNPKYLTHEECLQKMYENMLDFLKNEPIRLQMGGFCV